MRTAPNYKGFVDRPAWRLLANLLLFIALPTQRAALAQAAPEAAPATYKFTNGQWFIGDAFAPSEFYSVRGILTHTRPAVVDKTVDLKQGYVLPPFGDAHCHGFNNPFDIAPQVTMYLRDGVFYAMVQNNDRGGARKVAAQVNTPASVDVIYAHGGLTGSFSHPIQIYEGLALHFYTPAEQRANEAKLLQSRLREGDAYYIVDTAADLQRQWPAILAGKPAFLKIFLLQSEAYEERKKRTGHGIGIDPKLVPAIVAKAHAAGLRVSAHVDSAADYHTALLGGVDIMAHLPRYFDATGDVHSYEISSEDAAVTARRKVFVIPTASLVEQSAPEQRERARANMVRNLRLLKKAGVQFGIGADTYGADAAKEALYLSTLGVFSNLELLKIWSEQTPRQIFPRRKIASLKDGYEASFIVLKANPLEQFDRVAGITARYKQGRAIE